MVKADNRILLALIGLTLIRGIIYISIVPPWLAPDEPAHFEAIRLIAQAGVWPTLEVYLTTPMHPQMPLSFEQFHIWQISRHAPPRGFLTPSDSTPQTFMAYYPPTSTGSIVAAGEYPLLYHLLLSPISALSKPLSIVAQVYLLRFTSLLLTTLTVVMGWLFARAIFPEQQIYAKAVVAFLIFLPMHLHVNTSINTDVLTTLLVSVYFLMLAQIFCAGFSWTRLILAGGCIFLAILTKPTALFTLATSGVALLMFLARRYWWRPRWLALLLPVLVLSALISSVLLFQLGNGGRILTMSFAGAALNWPGSYLSRDSLAVYVYTIQWGFLSFWGLFGWANIPIPGAWLRVLWGVCLLVGVGVGKFLFALIRQPQSHLKPAQKDLFIVLFLSLIFAFIGIYAPIIATQSTRWGPPGRYLFPALLPIALYFFIGFQQLIPEKFNPIALPLWLVSLIFFDSLTMFYVLLPAIYG